MVDVAAGTFQMGSNDGSSDEKPVHSVTLSNYSIGKTEVTVGEYLPFCQETNGNLPEWLEKGNEYNVETGKNDHSKKLGYSRSANQTLPIVGVSWNDAIAYCKWLSPKTGKRYTLPSEAQWEYAARGRNNSNGFQYSGSKDLKAVAWYGDNSGNKTHAVGGKSANELGIYDMSGNVWEWCNDWYGSYSSAAVNNQGLRRNNQVLIIFFIGIKRSCVKLFYVTTVLFTTR